MKDDINYQLELVVARQLELVVTRQLTLIVARQLELGATPQLGLVVNLSHVRWGWVGCQKLVTCQVGCHVTHIIMSNSCIVIYESVFVELSGAAVACHISRQNTNYAMETASLVKLQGGLAVSEMFLVHLLDCNLIKSCSHIYVEHSTFLFNMNHMSH